MPPAVIFQPQDSVKVRNFPPGAFAPAWTGPHTIIQRTSDATYEVLINGNQTNVHLNDLRPVRAGNEMTFEDESPYASSETSGKEFVFPLVESEPEEEPAVTQEVEPESVGEPTNLQVLENGQTEQSVVREIKSPRANEQSRPVTLESFRKETVYKLLFCVENRVQGYDRHALASAGRPGDK